GGLRLTVRDTGIGIPADLLPHIFRPFEQGPGTAPRGGLGLGLTITHGIVEAHGGSIEADSPGRAQGTTFTIELPTVPPAGATDGTGTRVAAPTRSLRLLVVEDDRDTSVAVGEILRLHG